MNKALFCDNIITTAKLFLAAIKPFLKKQFCSAFWFVADEYHVEFQKNHEM